MNQAPLRGSTALVGVGLAGCGEAPGRTALELSAEAVGNAIEDAGLKISDIDGILTASAYTTSPSLQMAEYLGIRPTFMDTTRLGGASFVDHLTHAALALEFGLCNVAVICYGSNQRTAHGKLKSMSELSRFEALYRPRFPVAMYALAASRHMHEFGTTAEQLAQVAVSARRWAQLNPEAFSRNDLTVAQVLAARRICDPLGVRDCCLVTDGAGAVVMVRADRASSLRQKPVYLLGGASATTHLSISAMPDLTVTGAAQSGARAFAMAGVTPSEVDVIELYDAFTINTILFLEDLGFCAKGEGGPLVESGAIAPGGRLPVNTNGGGLSCVHPGMYGVFTMIEATRQLRGACQERQVAHAELALCHGNGGVLSAQVTAILGTEATLH